MATFCARNTLFFHRIGQNSKFAVDDVILSSSSRARKFSVSATAGTFRFLSGRSSKKAYQIKTPTATMGIRGTEFDFTVRGRRVTNLLTHGGGVQICTSTNSCARVRGGGCSPVLAPRRGRVQVPEDNTEKAAILRDEFPFTVDQRRVSRSLRVNSSSCQKLLAVAVQRNRNTIAPTQVPTPTPTPNPTPSPTPTPDPGGEPDNAPGQSGTKGGGNSQGKGASQSNSAGGQGKGHDK
ncbi:MAG: hypothetical protein GKR99_16695 [Rhodobacteraceae bacterium]|nr:hypothetical protein [Paracoccaceae bacterium]